MDTSEKLFASRVIIGSLAFVFLIIGYVTYTEYSNEIEDHLFEVVTDTFPNLDNELAQL